MNLNLKNRKALVCGSTQGIGLAIAKRLAEEGAIVTLLGRNLQKLEELVNELGGTGHSYLKADFFKYEELQALEEQVTNGEFSILVNNAGGPPPGLVHESEWDDFEKAIDMHLKASHFLSKSVIPSMKVGGYGRIINIISTSVRIPIDGLGVSNTVRGAMASWSKTLSNEVGQFGITVNNILPGFIETGRLSGLVTSWSKKDQVSEDEMVDKLKATVPVRRFGRPEELAALAVFLCGDEAGYLNGINIPFDGGRTGSI